MKVGALITEALQEQKRREECWLYGRLDNDALDQIFHFNNQFVYLRYFEYCRRPKIWFSS
jgi:hypothetical protein